MYPYTAILDTACLFVLGKVAYKFFYLDHFYYEDFYAIPAHLILIQEVNHRKLKPLIAVFKVTYKVRNTAI